MSIDDEICKFLLLFCCLINPISSFVILKSIYSDSSFPDSPARFSRGLKLNGSAICGNLRLADPPHACSPLLNEVQYSGATSIALIVRGKCTFEEKIRNAQNSGFRAAIVYDDHHDNHNLISMMGNPEGIWMHAVFVSNAAGEILREHAQAEGRSECCIILFIDETAWTVLVISFISVLAVIFLLGMIFFTYNHRWNHQQTQQPVMDDKAVDILPCITFGSVSLICHVGDMCAICLEDYKHGESLKLLPCNHAFHGSCVNSWLTKWATSCPVCKHDVRTESASSTN